MQTCGIQLKWEVSSTESYFSWSIDNITISNDSNPRSMNRREAIDLHSINHHILKRQAVIIRNLYYDNFDNGRFDATIWYNIYGGRVFDSPCRAPSQWLYFTYAWTRSRSAVTQPLDLQQLKILTFFLLFWNTENDCNLQITSDTSVSVDYRIGSSGSWVNLKSYNRSCCLVPTMKRIVLPTEAQTNNVHLRWIQQNSNGYYRNDYDAWAIDEVRIDEDNILYQDTFSHRKLNTNLWLSVVGGRAYFGRSCGRLTFSLLFFSDISVRQAITHYLNFSQIESFSIHFYFQLCDISRLQTNNETIEIAWRPDNGEWSLLDVIPPSYSRYVTLGCYNVSGIDSIQFRLSQTLFSSPFDRWSIDDFEIRSHNSSSCSATAIPMLTSTQPTQPSTPTTCNYYSDNFDDGLYKTSLWYTVSGIRISYGPCGIQHYHYAMEFYSPSNRQLITQILDLHGVEYISFRLHSVTFDNNGRCIASYGHSGYLSVAYSIAGNGIWYNLVNFAPGCCFGNRITLRLPVAVQVTSVQLRWLDSATTYASMFNGWILDDVRIGENVDTILYQDTFNSFINPTLWSSIEGGQTTSSYCGIIDSRNPLVLNFIKME